MTGLRQNFATVLHEGNELERNEKWEDAIETYSRFLATLQTQSDPDLRAMRAIALLRRGNALMELRRWEDARTSLDEALNEAKGSGDPAIVAQALLAAGVFVANQDDSERGEAFLNLATLYGKTGRLDLAFVTFTKAQDVLGVAEDWAGVAAAWEAQAQLRRAIHDEDRWREDLAEAVLFYDRDGMKAKADRLRSLLGKKRV